MEELEIREGRRARIWWQPLMAAPFVAPQSHLLPMYIKSGMVEEALWHVDDIHRCGCSQTHVSPVLRVDALA